MPFDEVIVKLGEFGKHQRITFILLCCPTIITAFYKIGNVFFQLVPDFRCKLPDEEPNATYTLTEEELYENYRWTDDKKKSALCTYLDKEENDTVKCESYIFSTVVMKNTVVTEWELICDYYWMASFSDSMFMVGIMIGSMVFGSVSDKYGRKNTYLASLILMLLFGVASAWTPYYWMYVVVRALVGGTTAGVNLVSYVLAMEMVGPSKRFIVGTISMMFFSFGYLLLIPFVLLIKTWKLLLTVLSLPTIIFIATWWLVPESVRWLMSRRKISESKKILIAVAKTNKVEIDEAQIEDLLTEQQSATSLKEAKKSHLFEIFKYRRMRTRSLIIFFDWCAISMGYYGLSWNSGKIGSNTYLTFMFSGLVEIPAYIFILCTINRYGRKVVLCGSLIVSGVVLIATIIISVAKYKVDLLLAIFQTIGKMTISVSYGCIYVFSTEQFPTVIRNSGLAAGSFSARIGGISAPYINLLGDYTKQEIPLVIYGAITFAAGIFSLWLPETMGKRLPETIQDAEAFGGWVPSPIPRSSEPGPAEQEVMVQEIAKLNDDVVPNNKPDDKEKIK